jgi:hypothetical protein
MLSRPHDPIRRGDSRPNDCAVAQGAVGQVHNGAAHVWQRIIEATHSRPRGERSSERFLNDLLGKLWTINQPARKNDQLPVVEPMHISQVPARVAHQSFKTLEPRKRWPPSGEIFRRLKQPEASTSLLARTDCPLGRCYANTRPRLNQSRI